jgi:hypothetical protein
MKVTFQRCGGRDADIVVDVPVFRDDDAVYVIDRAAARWCPAEDGFGAGFFFQDSGISTPDTWYGQIFRPCPPSYGGGSSSVTGRVRVDVNAVRAGLPA